ncbi:N-acetyltransferase [Emticicia sp. 17c]|uniref:N-acetyltransferase n=1 Tax=Emticicia sp. 17c TaxID=3127704 RepID=UPI00301C312F
MENQIQIKSFSQIDINNPFFDSLKLDYREFEKWFAKKASDGAEAYLLIDKNNIEAFLYLKIEEDDVLDIEPPLPRAKRVKVGTFKVNPHGTRLGERFIKKIFDYAFKHNTSQVYVTIFDKHIALIQLFEKYGFKRIALKHTNNGTELVFLKDFNTIQNDVLLDYPRFKLNNNKKFLLSIYPEYHTRLFPDSILNNESFSEIEDVSHTNSIHKVYICFMDVSVLKTGDLILIYRTKDDKGPAYYRSVVTSVCVVEEVRVKANFNNINDFLNYCKPYSVFKQDELLDWFSKKNIFVIKMTYNAAFQKKITRGNLIDNLGYNSDIKWSFFEISNEQFLKTLKAGGVNESVIINQT